MMRVAVLSDVHANYYALEAVLKDIEKRGIDAYWYLGDFIGRGFQPTAVVKTLQRIYQRQSPGDQRCWLCGNHEMLLFNRVPHGFLEAEGSSSLTVSGDNAYAVQTILSNEAELRHRPELLDWLSKFPTHSHPYPYIYLAHAAYAVDDQGNIDEDVTFRLYQFEDETVKDTLARLYNLSGIRCGLILSGHTHISGLWQWEAMTQTVKRAQQHRMGHQFDLSQSLVFVNVGSVGFPRMTDTCPTYVILTTHDTFSTVEIEFIEVPFDHSEVEFPASYPDIYKKEMQRCKG
jgi:hypothetical protein